MVGGGGGGGDRLGGARRQDGGASRRDTVSGAVFEFRPQRGRRHARRVPDLACHPAPNRGGPDRCRLSGGDLGRHAMDSSGYDAGSEDPVSRFREPERTDAVEGARFERSVTTMTPHLPFTDVPTAIEEIRAGRMIVVIDDEDRENEGDLTLAAEKVTPEAINFMAKHGRGLGYLAMTEERLYHLRIGPMTSENT